MTTATIVTRILNLLVLQDCKDSLGGFDHSVRAAIRDELNETDRIETIDNRSFLEGISAW
jgi:hypothetical protein